MTPLDVHRLLRETERVLESTYPSFDITETERWMMHTFAATIRGIFAERDHRDQKEFLMFLSDVTHFSNASLQGVREHLGKRENGLDDEEKEEAVIQFDEQFGAACRIGQIHQAMNVAYFRMLTEEETLLGRARAFGRKCRSVLPWHWSDSHKKSILARIPKGMDVEAALELASGRDFCNGGVCSATTQRIVTLFLTGDASQKHVRAELQEMGFIVIETERVSVLGSIRRLLTGG